MILSISESENPKSLIRSLHQFVQPNCLVCNITREISINMIYDNQSVIICVYVLIYAYGELCCVLESIKKQFATLGVYIIGVDKKE